ncbi:MAG: hypothetical protein ABIT58_05450 [Ferruginibacter sp.]
MKRFFMLSLFTFSILGAKSQVQLAKIIGKGSDQFTLGYGGFFKFSYQLTQSSDVSLELGVLSFSVKDNTRYGWDVVPLKVGYRYILTRKSSGPYVEPQLGYNIFGIDPSDKTFTGFIWGGGIGYLFKPIGKIKFDLGLRYESVSHSGGALNYLMLRLSHNFSFGRRF